MDVQDASELSSVSLDELAASVNTTSQKIISPRGSIPLESKKSSRHLTFNNHPVSGENVPALIEARHSAPNLRPRHLKAPAPSHCP